MRIKVKPSRRARGHVRYIPVKHLNPNGWVKIKNKEYKTKFLMDKRTGEMAGREGREIKKYPPHIKKSQDLTRVRRITKPARYRKKIYEKGQIVGRVS